MKKSILPLLHSESPCIMGILNSTPDSFFDGGQYLRRTAALARAHKMVNAGVDIIDVGGESSRPGSDIVSPEEACDRVIPLITALVAELDVPLSVDTRHPLVMVEAIKAGVSMINDVNALQSEGAIDVAQKANIPVCIMHAKGDPKDMQHNPFYENVVTEVYDFLKKRAEICQQAGIPQKNIVIDVGFGFGKNLDHNLSLLKNMNHFKKLGYPILAGVSNKHMIGLMLNRDVTGRLYGTLAVEMMAYMNGASIIRTHDVGAACDVMKVTERILRGE